MFLKNRHLAFSYNYPNILNGILVILFFCLPFLSFSQNIKDSIQELPHAIKNTEIADYRQNNKILIEDTELLLLELKNLQLLKSQIISEDSIFSSKIAIFKDSLSRFSLTQLDRLENGIQEYRSQLNKQEQIISNWRNQTNIKQEQINFDFQNWQLTKDSLEIFQNKIKLTDSTQLNILARVNGQVDRSLEGLTALQDKFTIWNEALIDNENTLTAAQGEVNEGNALLKSKRKDILKNIWIPEYDPIWKIQLDDYKTYDTKFKTIINSRIQRIKEHYKSNPDFYFSVLFSFIFVLSIVIFLKIKSRKHVVLNPTTTYDIHLLIKYPILSTLIILSLVVFVFFSIPLELKSLLLLISIIPFAILIWELNSKNKVLTVSLFVIYCILFVSLPLLGEYAFLLRFALLIINSLSLVLLLLLQKNSQIIEEENNYWLGTLHFLISSFIFFNILAIATNIIGNVQLTVILTETIIGTFLAFQIIKESLKLLHSFLYLLIIHTLFAYSNILKDDSEKVLLGLYKLLKYSGYFFWIYLILGFLKVRKILTEYFMIFINKPLQVGEISISLGNIMAFFIIIQLSVWISQFIRYFLDKEVYPRTSINKGIASTFSLMIRYTFIVIGFVLALAGAGLEYSKIAIGMGALGIGIGFGLQNIVNNFMSGIILAIERPIKIGDIVKVGEIEGEVKDIGLRASQIKTWDGADVIVPNGSLISEKLINWTLNDRNRRLEIEVKLDLESDVLAASKIILKAANETPKLLKIPKPSINFEGLKDGAAVIKVYAWINNYSDSFTIGTSFKIVLYHALVSNGFKLANPILDVNVNNKKASPEQSN